MFRNQQLILNYYSSLGCFSKKKMEYETQWYHQKLFNNFLNREERKKKVPCNILSEIVAFLSTTTATTTTKKIVIEQK